MKGRDDSEIVGLGLLVSPFLGSPAAELETIIDFWSSALIANHGITV